MTDTQKNVGEGAFIASLKRNNTKIREDRATAIAEDAMVLYRRTVEDLEIKINKMKRDRESMLDLSPTHADSLVLASEFDAAAYVAKDVELGVNIRNAEIKLGIATGQYERLFGGVS